MSEKLNRWKKERKRKGETLGQTVDLSAKDEFNSVQQTFTSVRWIQSASQNYYIYCILDKPSNFRTRVKGGTAMRLAL